MLMVHFVYKTFLMGSIRRPALHVVLLPFHFSHGPSNFSQSRVRVFDCFTPTGHPRKNHSPSLHVYVGGPPPCLHSPLSRKDLFVRVDGCARIDLDILVSLIWVTNRS
jgi:hypothetical protein